MSAEKLKGLRVLNTRPVGQAEEWSFAIEQAGGVVVACPALAIVATTTAWLKALPPLESIKHAIFISANAVHYYFIALQQAGLIWPALIQVIAIGQATTRALIAWGIRVDWVPTTADSEHVINLPSLQQIAEQSILLVKGEGGRAVIAETLRQRGAKLHSMDVYRRVPPTFSPQQVESLWRNDAVDIILFTSHFAMQNVFTLFGEQANAWLCDKPCIVLSKRLAAAAQALGIKKSIISSPEKLIDALHQFNLGLVHDNRK